MWSIFNMFSGLFGSSSQPVAPPVDYNEAYKKMEVQIANIDAKCKVLQVKSNNYKKEALAKNKSADKRDKQQALLFMKKMKAVQAEMDKLDGMKVLLEQQKMTLDSSRHNTQVFDTLKVADSAVKYAQKDLNVEKFEELKERIDETEEHSRDVNAFFGNIGQEGNDELMMELEQLDMETEPISTSSAKKEKKPAQRVDNGVTIEKKKKEEEAPSKKKIELLNH